MISLSLTSDAPSSAILPLPAEGGLQQALAAGNDFALILVTADTTAALSLAPSPDVSPVPPDAPLDAMPVLLPPAPANLIPLPATAPDKDAGPDGPPPARIIISLTPPNDLVMTDSAAVAPDPDLPQDPQETVEAEPQPVPTDPPSTQVDPRLTVGSPPTLLAEWTVFMRQQDVPPQAPATNAAAPVSATQAAPSATVVPPPVQVAAPQSAQRPALPAEATMPLAPQTTWQPAPQTAPHPDSKTAVATPATQPVLTQPVPSAPIPGPGQHRADLAPLASPSRPMATPQHGLASAAQQTAWETLPPPPAKAPSPPATDRPIPSDPAQFTPKPGAAPIAAQPAQSPRAPAPTIAQPAPASPLHFDTMNAKPRLPVAQPQTATIPVAPDQTSQPVSRETVLLPIKIAPTISLAKVEPAPPGAAPLVTDPAAMPSSMPTATTPSPPAIAPAIATIRIVAIPQVAPDTPIRAATAPTAPLASQTPLPTATQPTPKIGKPDLPTQPVAAAIALSPAVPDDQPTPNRAQPDNTPPPPLGNPLASIPAKILPQASLLSVTDPDVPQDSATKPLAKAATPTAAPQQADVQPALAKATPLAQPTRVAPAPAPPTQKADPVPPPPRPDAPEQKIVDTIRPLDPEIVRPVFRPVAPSTPSIAAAQIPDPRRAT